MVQKLQFDNIEDVEMGDIDGQFKDVSDLQKDIDAQIDAIFQEFGGDDNDSKFKIIVKRAMHGKGDLEHCFSCVPSELPIIDRIKETYGAGSYEIWVYKDGKIFKRPKLNIAKEIKLHERPQINTNDINSVIQSMLQSQQDQMAEFKNMMFMMMQKNNVPAPDPTSTMGSMMGVMMQMKDFMGGGDSGKGKMDDILQAVKLVREIGGGDDGGRNFMDGMVDLAKSFGPSIIEMSSNLAKNPAPVSRETIPQNPTGQIESKPQEEDPRMNMFKMQLDMLVQKASINSDPALYADLVVDNIPQDQLIQFINRTDIIEYLISIHPGVGEHRIWFGHLVGEIKSCISAEDEPLTDPLSQEWTDKERLTDEESTNTIDNVDNTELDKVIDASPTPEKETDK